MRQSALDDRTADLLLDGRLGPEDAPPEYAALAAAIRALRSPASEAELAGEAAMVEAVSAAVRAAPVVAPTSRRLRWARAPVTRGAAVTAALLIGTATAAAATGSLPEPAQEAIAHFAKHLGLSIPGTTEHNEGTTPNHVTGNGAATGPSPSGPDQNGLCTAAGTAANPDSVAFRQLAAAAGAQSQSVTVFCTSALTPPGNSAHVTSPGPSSSNVGHGANPSHPEVQPSGKTGGPQPSVAHNDSKSNTNPGTPLIHTSATTTHNP
jgi:hypothetical protein